MRREERFDNPPCLFLQSLLGWVSASRVVYVSLAARSVSSGCIHVSSLSGTWGSLHLLKVCWSAWKERKMYGTYSEDAIYEQINQKSIHEYVRCVCWWTNNNIQWLCPLSCPRQMQNVWKILHLRAKEPKFLKSSSTWWNFSWLHWSLARCLPCLCGCWGHLQGTILHLQLSHL